jgi:hypothetical protein
MTVRLANEIRPASLPAYCSACFNQDPSLQHIDFDAASDRGYGDGTLPVPMDDLILCENCVRTAARLLGMQDRTELERELSESRRRFTAEHRRADNAVSYAESLEKAFSERPNPIDMPRRAGRLPKYGEQ